MQKIQEQYKTNLTCLLERHQGAKELAKVTLPRGDGTRITACELQSPNLRLKFPNS